MRSTVMLLAFALLGAAATSCASADPIVGPAPQQAQDIYVPDPPGYRAVPWVEGLEVPWSLVFLGDGRALVSERPGRIRLIRDGVLQPEPYAAFETTEGAASDLTDFFIGLVTGGEGGLMGLAVHPGFPEQPFIYAMHTYRDPEGGNFNRVVRLRDEGDRARFDRVIIDGIPASRFHNGGRLAFGPDGMLYVTTGDASKPGIAQDLESLGGKILRLTPEGGIPDDNPFPGSPVYSYGHRNPQGLAWHPKTGDLFATEHGPSGEFGLGAYDEINLIDPGGNYGWPEVVGAPGLVDFIDPIVVWTQDAVPPGDAAFHDGALFVATMKSESLVRIELAQTADGYRVERIAHWFADEWGEGRYGRLRDVTVGPDGTLYFTTTNRDGRGDPRPGDDTIYRLERVD
jgi:glucose/arabinose dehydrogenase